MPLSVPSRITPDECDHGPAELHSAHATDRAEFLRLDQLDRIRDDHGCQRRLRHQRDQRRQQQHRGHGRRRSDQRGQLCARPGTPIDRGLRSAAAGGHRAEHAAAHVGQAEGEQFPVRHQLRFTGCPERPGRGDALGEAHQGNAGGRWPQRLQQSRAAARSTAATRWARDRRSRHRRPEDPANSPQRSPPQWRSAEPVPWE